ncbi:hypothetical protein [Brevibacillus dissolubilis]|uniref:hypothetical protein n=1 Tax=Brevibacillus dissolubilis TaxID=1844116 RepID=UPI0011171710|nr:hypothetical protein [Brevibacillus dissolubilis]
MKKPYPHLMAVYDSPQQAEQVFNALQSFVKREDISIVHQAPDEYSTRDLSTDTVADGIGWGALGGSGLGLAIGMSTILIPGIGPLIALGPIMTTLSGLVVGGITGGLIDMGINRYTAEAMTEHVKKGLVVLTVAIPNESLRQSITNLLDEHGAIEIHEEEVMLSQDAESRF